MKVLDVVFMIFFFQLESLVIYAHLFLSVSLFRDLLLQLDLDNLNEIQVG